MLKPSLTEHHKPKGMGDHLALGMVKFLRFFADSFFKKRYGHRAVVIETIAAVPGMVGGMFLHLKCLRRLQDDHGWIKALLEEAENERMHLMTFLHIAKPNFFERVVIIAAQVFIIVLYALIYILSPKTAHRFVGYLEEEAIVSYTEYLEEVEEGLIPNIKAPEIAKKHWKLKKNARLRDLILVIREDERRHRDVNHTMATSLGKKHIKEI